MLQNWLHIFLFQIKNNKLFTALNVLGLSIGIAGLIFAILYWNDEHSGQISVEQGIFGTDRRTLVTLRSRFRASPEWSGRDKQLCEKDSEHGDEVRSMVGQHASRFGGGLL